MPHKDPEARKVWYAAYVAANADKLKARQDAWRAANADKLKARRAAYYEANKTRLIAQQIKYKEANRERYNELARVRYEQEKLDPSFIARRREDQKKSRLKHAEKLNAARRLDSAKHVCEMSDRYVKDLLVQGGAVRSAITPQEIATKRSNLEVLRTPELQKARRRAAQHAAYLARKEQGLLKPQDKIKKAVGDAEYRKKNKERLDKIEAAGRVFLSDGYVRRVTVRGALPFAAVSDDLVEMKRLQLTLTRELRAAKKETNDE